MIAWLSGLPGHQQPWYWLCNLGQWLPGGRISNKRPISVLGKDKHASIVFVSENTFSTTRVNSLLAPVWCQTISWTNADLMAIDRSHVTTAIWWPLGVAVVSVTCMRVRWISHTWKYTQWNIFLFESSDKSPYWTNPYHLGFRYEVSLNFHTYFGRCPSDIYILLHIPVMFVQTTCGRG